MISVNHGNRDCCWMEKKWMEKKMDKGKGGWVTSHNLSYQGRDLWMRDWLTSLRTQWDLESGISPEFNHGSFQASGIQDKKKLALSLSIGVAKDACQITGFFRQQYLLNQWPDPFGFLHKNQLLGKKEISFL